MKSGDVTEHFDQLYRDNYVKVYRLALGLANRVGFDNLASRFSDAEDITQEAFLRAFRSFDTFQENSSFFTWICRITINIAHDYMRQRAKLPIYELLERFGCSEAKYSKEFAAAALFESYLKESGIKTVRNEYGGITAARWAAFKAGLGMIIKNNFFYTRHGSWVMFETWLTDQEMEYHETEVLPPCPDNCTKCIDACPTGALAIPYRTNAVACITYLTCWVKDAAPEHLRDKMGTWLYGCDVCQDVCPMNKGKCKR